MLRVETILIIELFRHCTAAHYDFPAYARLRDGTIVAGDYTPI